ncbi:MAG: 30S ribosomal protein S18 [Candidatus Microgenomates bacterium]
MAIKKSSRRKSMNRKLKPVAVNCVFCNTKTVPDYKKYGDLGKYITERAKIQPKTRTGLCAKHQRRVAQEIKRARQVGLLPFTGSL